MGVGSRSFISAPDRAEITKALQPEQEKRAADGLTTVRFRERQRADNETKE